MVNVAVVGKLLLIVLVCWFFVVLCFIVGTRLVCLAVLLVTAVCGCGLMLALVVAVVRIVMLFV